MNRDIRLKETIELFLTKTIYDIRDEIETPRINFIFKDEAYKLFESVMNNPFKLKNYWTPDIKKEDIQELKKLKDYDCPTIYVKDHIKFFTYLTEITNNLIKLYNNYNENKLSRNLLIQLMRRIWLRMGPTDFNNVENFLYRQLIFVRTDIFKHLKFNFKQKNIIEHFYSYKVTATNSINRTWDESTKCMSFEILKNEEIHSLPDIYYDIINETCYIYAIQNNRLEKKVPEIQKLIYKTYRGISQPNKVYALKLFINMIKEKNIKKIKIPTLQVLNNRYHELLSKKEIDKFNKEWPKKRIENFKNLNKTELEKELYSYNLEKIWYNHIVNNEHTISKLKTEDFIYLIYKIVNEDNSLTLTNDINISDTLDIVIKKINRK